MKLTPAQWTFLRDTIDLAIERLEINNGNGEENDALQDLKIAKAILDL